MINPQPQFPQSYERLVALIHNPAHQAAGHRNACWRLIAALRCVASALARATSSLLAAAGAEAALFLGADSTWVLPCERARPRAPALLARVVEPPDLHAAIGGLLYPGYPGAIVRFTDAMVGTELMTNYPWSREHGWAARN